MGFGVSDVDPQLDEGDSCGWRGVGQAAPLVDQKLMRGFGLEFWGSGFGV